MFKIFLACLVLTNFSFSKDAEVKYLNGQEAHLLIQSGKNIKCEDSKLGLVHLKKEQFEFVAAGLYFYNVNNTPVMTEK
mgnify:CR=1 FL=1